MVKVRVRASHKSPRLSRSRVLNRGRSRHSIVIAAPASAAAELEAICRIPQKDELFLLTPAEIAGAAAAKLAAGCRVPCDQAADSAAGPL